MEMDSTRRRFDRSLSKEPGLKKPRLNEDPAAPDRISNGRAGIFPVSNLGVGGVSRVQRERDSESSDSVRVPYQPQPGQQLHQELVTQYKSALSELTFNSKPIITNLTIIAGESLQAAKAIAATICTNILEVPSEQKLPSLYLLDSIVKNIGRDYIKYFASRLPEVFCKVYRQVDPSVHSGMRHLFGTWKGVFPPQTLQLIEKELGFTTTPNGSSSATTSRPESQAQRPAHSIHVNPKYLEARQRLQTTRARGAGSDTSEALVNSPDDVEALERTTSISSGKSWADPYAKPIQHHHLRDQVNEPVRDKSLSVAYSNSEYGSTISMRPGSGTGRVIEKVKEPGYDRPWYASGSDATGMTQQKNGFGLKRGHAAHESDISDCDLQLKQKVALTNSNGMSKNWKNSEEEEYVWEEMNSRPTARGSADALAKDHWAPDNYDRLDFDSHLQRSQNIHDIGSRDAGEASSDSLSMDRTQVPPRTRLPVWSQKSHPPEERILSVTGKTISGYSERYPTEKSSTLGLGKTYSLSQLDPASIEAPISKFSANTMLGPNVSTTQPRQALGAISSLTRSVMHQHPPPSPTISSQNPKKQLLNNFPERYQTPVSLPTDPRRPPGHKSMGSRDQFSEDVYQGSTQRVLPQSLRSSSALMAPSQQRKHAPSAQMRNIEVSELPSKITGSESRSANSSSDQSNPQPIDSPGKSITSSLFDAVGKGGIPKSTNISGSLIKPGSQEVRPGSSTNIHGSMFISTISQKPLATGPPPVIGPEKTTSAVNSTSNSVSSLLSSLVAKGLISSSKSDSVICTSAKIIPDQPLDRVSSVPVASSKSLIPVIDEPSSFKPAVSASDDLPESQEKIKNLIGFEFRPDVIRNLHPDVISDLLSDVPHQCSICGLRLKLQELFDRHMEWHASRVPEDNSSLSKASRRWYTNLVDWVARIDPSDISGCSDDEILDCSQPMVPADESQCACILCGELFEDFYCQEKDEWMFKGAIYLTDPSSESRERIATTSDAAALWSPIVHADCLSEESVHDLGLVCDVKLELNA